MEFTPATTGLITGIGLCTAAGLRCAHAAGRWLGEQRRERREFLASLQQFEDELDQQASPPAQAEAAWQGYRRFAVQQVVAEADDITSVYLAPEDRRPLPAYKPGQYLTFRIQVPGEPKPAVRCYSLSDRPRPDHYRITVKAIVRDPLADPKRGIVSRYMNRALRPGDVLEAQAPRGDFYLRDDDRPAVLIGAGVGITPLLAMTNTLLHSRSQRKVLLFYGVRNSREHAFHTHLRDLAASDSRLVSIPCYSQPLSTDRGAAFVPQRIDLDLIRRFVPEPIWPCYICGPGEFMQSIVGDLANWGVAEQDLHFEAFGPASIRKPTSQPADVAPSIASQVKFQQSEITADWNGSASSLLELGERQGVNLPSGCRTGNCGMCASRLIAGKVRYNEMPAAPLDPGFCLTCVAQPDCGELVLDV